MRGYKTWIAGVGLISIGAYGFFASWMDGYSALQWILNGLGFIGVGHKIDKGSST